MAGSGPTDEVNARYKGRHLDHLDEFVAPDFVRHCQARAGVDVRSLEAFKAFLKDDTATFLI